MTWFLIDASGYRYPLTAAGLHIGRAAENDIVLADEESSRRHAYLALQGEEAWLHDQDSFNGLFVNGQRLTQPQRLRHGDLIRLGQSQLQVEWVAGPQLQPLSASVFPPSAATTAPPVTVKPSSSAAVWQAALAGVGVGLLGLVVVFFLFVRPLLDAATPEGTPANTYAAYAGAIQSVAFVLAPIEDTPNANAGTAVTLNDSGRLLTAYSAVYDPDTGQPYNRRSQVLIGFRGDGRYAGAALDRWYLARVVRADRQRDLAVLQIYAQQDGSPLPNSFRLQAAPLGRGDQINPGDGLAVLSFPVTGANETGAGRYLAIGEGQALGFAADAALNEPRGWLHSDIALGPDNLGGLVLNRQGQVVGLYTGAASADPAISSQFRPIELAEPLLAGSR